MKTQDRTIRDVKIGDVIINMLGRTYRVLDVGENGFVYETSYYLTWEEAEESGIQIKQPEKQEIEKLGYFGATNEAWLRLLTRKLDEVIEAVNKLLKE